MTTQSIARYCSVLLFLLAVSCGDDEGPVAPTNAKRIFHNLNGTLGLFGDSEGQTVEEAADRMCQEGAGERGLGGNWRAYVSTSAEDAIDRIADVGPWYRLDRSALLFQDKAEVRRGPRVPIVADSAPDEAKNLFWSGTKLDGTASEFLCGDWGAAFAGNDQRGSLGRVDRTGADWIVPEPMQCTTYIGVLCFEQ